MKKSDKMDVNLFRLKILSIVSIGLIIVSILTIFMLYRTTINSMIISFESRAYAIASSVYDDLDEDSFTEVNTIEDMNSDIYIRDHDNLNFYRGIGDLKYIYTAKYNEDGLPIYVTDGLDYNSDDFQYPGDLIEDVSVNNITKALEGDISISEDIIVADWGIVFPTYWPIFLDGDKACIYPDHADHINEEPIGALGIEIDVADIYSATMDGIKTIVITTIFIAALLMIILYFSLRKITSPYFKHLALTDHLTQIGNRTAYEMHISEISHFKNVILIVFDLNNLKVVNDTYGHEKGDQLIKNFAKLLTEIIGERGKCYRIGGDEFVVIIENFSVLSATDMLKNNSIINSKEEYKDLSYAYGIAEFIPDTDKNLGDTFERADKAMYLAKQRQKKEKNKI